MKSSIPTSGVGMPASRRTAARPLGVTLGLRALPCLRTLSAGAPARCSTSCLCRRSNIGRSLRMGGSRSKLYAGGGEEVAHSSVFASHGSSPTRSPLIRVATTFTRNGRMLTAIMKAPIVEIRFSSFQPAIGRVVGDASRHALDAEHVHREEGEVEADELDPEVDLAEAFVQLAAGHLGEPEVGRREDPEDRSAEEDVMQVRHHEVGILQVEVDRRAGQHHAR